MAPDSITTTTSKSWTSRIGNAFAGILFGIILFLGSFVLLTWNEGRAIKREKVLKEGAGQVVSLPAPEVVAENNGKLIHFTGTAEAEGPVEDPVFGITADALKLRRTVEMFQWKQSEKSETKEKLGGGEETTTTYTYSKEWSEALIDSSQFHAPEGHQNPQSFPVNSETFVAPGIHVGQFDLPESLINSIDNFSPFPVTAEQAQKAAEYHNEPIKPTTGGGFYIGENPAAPVIGDVRINFAQAPSGPVSVIAAQLGNTLEPFTVRDLGSIELLKTGAFSAAVMFQQEQEANVTLTWILRFVGFLMMLFGLLLITNVLSVIASVVPFLGNIVNAGLGLMMFAIALPLTLVTIALAWLAYRPLIGIPLLVLAGVSIFFAGAKLMKKKKA